MGLTEEAFSVFHNFPKIEAGMEIVEEEGERKEFWLSKDERRQVSLTIMGGGKGWKDTWLKEIGLLCINEIVGSELMRVQYVKNMDTGLVTTVVFVDILTVKNDGLLITKYSYFGDNDGRLEEVCGQNHSFNKTYTMESLIEAVATEEVRFGNELPKRIDVEETARLFIEQLEERNFSLPVLVDA